MSREIPGHGQEVNVQGEETEETAEDKEKAVKEQKLRKGAAEVAKEWNKQGKKAYDFYTGLKVPKFRKGTREFPAPVLQGTRTYEEDKREHGWSDKRLITEAINLMPEDLIAHIAEQAGIEKNDELYENIEPMIIEELQKIEAQQAASAEERKREAKKKGIDEPRLRAEAKRIADEWRKAGLTATQFHVSQKEDGTRPPQLRRTYDPHSVLKYEDFSTALLIGEVMKKADIPDELYDEVFDQVEEAIRGEIQVEEAREKVEKA